MDYSPHLARLLLALTKQEIREAATKAGEPIPELETLVLGCPDYEFARVAAEAMIQQWAILGVKAEKVVLPSSQLAQVRGCDLIYVQTTMWEPAIDIQRLLGGNGIAPAQDPFIIQALEHLRDARNWREIRDELQDLHQLIAYHLPVLPLWQVMDRFAVSRYLDGLEDGPISIYQDVDSWRVNLGFRAILSQR
jgi:hypothetical protein